MKIIHDPEPVRRYINQFDLSTIFSKHPHLPIQLRQYECNELVLRDGDELDGLYYQVEGRTKVSSSVETGKSLLLRFCHPLSVFGDIELFQKVAVQSRVEAVQQSSFLFIDKRAVEADLMQDHHFLTDLLRHLSYKLQTCTAASRINLLASVEERLAGYLLTTRLQHEFGKELHTPHSHEIASLIGTTPRHLNRVIRKLTDMNILEKSRKEIIVSDWQALNKLSNGLRYE